MDSKKLFSQFSLLAAVATLIAAPGVDAAKGSSSPLGMRAPRSSNLMIQSAAAAGKNKSGKGNSSLAPNMEDYADYFSNDRETSSRVDQRKADEVRLKTIASIKKLLADRKDKSARNFELILRLGELYVERHDG
ncbi:MAG: hypothetical protein EBU49_10320, partial [Proteobacteria bacterium]|nr:hypothetical protein [Pseudomonadota bacterium]